MSERPTLELSADQVRADGGAFLITMPGEDDPTCVENWPICVNGGYDPRCCRFPKSCSVNEVPPSVLVALNQPCPKCAIYPGHAIMRGGEGDCGGSGRLVFDLRTPTDHSGGGGVSHETVSTVTHRVWLDPEWGILPIDREVPIGGLPPDERSTCPETPHAMIVRTDAAPILMICNGIKTIEHSAKCPPAARPGDYVARAAIFGGSHE